MSRVNAPAPPRLALSIEEAAQSLGVCRDSFDRYVLPHVRVTQLGRRKVVAVRELEEYLRKRAV